MDNPEVIETPEVQAVEPGNTESALDDLNDCKVAIESMVIAMEEMIREADDDSSEVEKYAQVATIVNNVQDDSSYNADTIAAINIVLDIDTLNVDGTNVISTESYKDLTMAKEYFNNALKERIIKAEKSNSSLMSRMINRLAEFFGNISRFSTRIRAANKNLDSLQYTARNKKINLSFKGNRFYTTRAGMVAGQEFFKKFNDNLDFAAEITEILVSVSEAMIDTEIGKEFFTDSEKYRSIFFDNYENFIDHFFDKLVAKGGITKKTSLSNSTIAINDDLLGGRFYKIEFPHDKFLPHKGDRGEYGFKLAKASINKFHASIVRNKVYHSEHEAIFKNLGIKELQDMLKNAEKTYEFVSSTANQLRRVMHIAYDEQQPNQDLGLPGMVIELILKYFVATLRLRRKAAVVVLNLSSQVANLQFELLSTAVLVAERSANPKYWDQQ